MDEYIPRLLDELLTKKLKSVGAVVIQGPKWCGKTTTAEHAAKSIIKMDQPDKVKQYMGMAELNPTLLLAGDTPRLIDEWQLAPNLWNAVRFEVDQRQQFGQFILTGSSTPKKKAKGTHSGTGRFSWIKMRPMSLFESGDSNGTVSIKELFSGKMASAISSSIDISRLAYLICRGGWPLAIRCQDDIALEQPFQYYEAILHTDEADEDENTFHFDPERMKQLMKSYARNISRPVPIETIRNDIIGSEDATFSKESLYEYINYLNRSFVIENSETWNPNLRSKAIVRTTPTKYFIDQSIGIAALGLGPNDLLSDLKTLGLFFENMALRDLRIYADLLDGDVYHYRDSYGVECDAVIHLRNGDYGLVEIKLGGDKAIQDGINSLNRLTDSLDTEKMKAPSFRMVLTGIGDYAFRTKEGIDIVPIGSLRP